MSNDTPIPNNSLFAKTDEELIAILSRYWKMSAEKLMRPFKVIATFKKSDKKDKKGNDFGFFEDVRDLNGNILYYPQRLGKVKIFSIFKEEFLSNEIGQINVKLAPRPQREKYQNPFMLIMDNPIVGKPEVQFLDKLKKEKLIKKIFKETGASLRDAKNLSNALQTIMGDLYTETERFIFELLQNADDQPQENALVDITLKTLKENLLFLHSGKPFSESDVESISSIGDSTKKIDAEKTGYKGIGFKSVFSDAETVFIDSGNFSFSFDKKSPIYSNESDMNIIPWQIKPIWEEKYHLPKEVQESSSYFDSPVAIALNVGEEKIQNYNRIIPKLLSEPRFILFLRNVGKVRYEGHNGDEIEISKSLYNNIIKINTINKSEEWIIKDYIIPISKDTQDALQNEKLVPKKLKEATKTKITFAAKIINGVIAPVDDSVLFTYLPTKVDDFEFKFLVNADFLTTASRESIHFENIWNRYLFENIGGLIIDWVKLLSDYSCAYSLLPLKDYDGDNSLCLDFYQSYRSAIESEAFILNHKGELAKQEEIIIDKTGLSAIIGADLFCKLLQTKKCLPSEKIDCKILEKDIFEYIEIVKFKDVIKGITNNSDFNNWYIIASDEQKETLHKWVNDNNTDKKKYALQSFVSSLPLFQFNEKYISRKDIESSNYIITTECIKPIKEVLTKLGFVCSNNVFDEGCPLCKFIKMQNKNALFNSIKECDFSKLEAGERKTLFIALKKFVGKETLKTIALFRNLESTPKPLGEMVAYREDVPKWLYPYVICKDDYCEELTDYIIKQNDEFAGVIQKHYTDLYASFAEIYNVYKDKWTETFTRQIIANNEIDDDILSIIEESDKRTQKYFLDSCKKLELLSSSQYKDNSYEYRVLKLALSVYDDPSDFSSKIYFDGQCIRSFSVSDEVICDFLQNGENKKVKMSLAKLLPQYENQSDAIDRIKDLFESKKGLDKFFKTTPKSIHEVYRELNQFLKIPEAYFSEWKVNNGNALQYLFATYYRRKVKHCGLGIDLTKETDEFIGELLDFLFKNEIAEKESPFTYHIKREYFTNKYFDSDYIFESEQLLPAIEKWAVDDKKKQYLIRNGVKPSDSNGILFRELFLENKTIDFIGQLSDADLKSGVEFIATASRYERPFIGNNQKDILLSLKDKCRDLSNDWDKEKIKESANEWHAKEYHKWSNNQRIRIFIYPGVLPSQLLYNNEVILNYENNEYNYYYDDQEKQLFVCNTRKIEAVLLEVAKEKNTNFNFDDYKTLCVDGIAISKEEEIKSLSEENRKKDEIIAQYKAKYGDLTTDVIDGSRQGSVSMDVLNKIHSNAQNEISRQSGKVIERDGLSREQQIAAHREAEQIIKDKLERNGYDCSSWIMEDSDSEYKKWQSINQVNGIISPDGEHINLVIKSAKGGYIYLSATDFEFLTSDSNNVLMVWDGCNVHSVTADDIFNKDSNVNLIFDTEYTPKHYYAALSKVFQYVKRTTFAVKNPSYNTYDAIKSFGMDSKTEGVQELFDDNDL